MRSSLMEQFTGWCKLMLLGIRMARSSKSMVMLSLTWARSPLRCLTSFRVVISISEPQVKLCWFLNCSSLGDLLDSLIHFVMLPTIALDFNLLYLRCVPQKNLIFGRLRLSPLLERLTFALSIVHRLISSSHFHLWPRWRHPIYVPPRPSSKPTLYCFIPLYPPYFFAHGRIESSCCSYWS